MKKVLSLLMIACANFVAMAQSVYVAEMKAKAEAGDAKEMYFLGQSYEYGHNGLEKDEATAVSWFKKSAESGYISDEISNTAKKVDKKVKSLKKKLKF